MNDDIIRFLDLKDANIESVSSIIRKGKRIVTLQKKLMVTYCPICSHRMHSKGIYKRVLNHPIMQDGMQLSIVLNQRRWKCSNPACQHSMNDEFSFIEPYRRITNATDLMIVNAFRDPSRIFYRNRLCDIIIFIFVTKLLRSLSCSGCRTVLSFFLH